MQTLTKSLVTLADFAQAFDLSDDEITSAADRAASSVQRLADLWQHHGTPEAAVLRTLRRVASGHCVTLPSKEGLKQRLNRMVDPGWWRRALRQRLQAVELHQIHRGAVHRRASAYVSPQAMRRFEANRKRLATLMESLEAVNEVTGEVIPLQDLINASQANPANRRKAMMARIKGIETHAKAQGHEAIFLTITCPSRMHPRHFTGASNERYDHTSPRRAQAYLGRLWNAAMRHAAHQGLTPYGMRVVEPHHDACPHWHVLVFIPASQVEAMAAIVRAYALTDSPNEPGAQERRFTVERIDPAKGSAVGYVAKYVSKSIDGEGVASDDESESTGADASRRIVAWSRTWRVRQFQFFGVPSITPTRELYRMDEGTLPGQALREAHQACKANDYAAWLSACQTHGLRFKVQYSERPSTRYAEESTRAIQGLRVHGGDVGGVLDLVTRDASWRIEPRQRKREILGQGAGSAPVFDFPWTRFNNSASLDFKGLFGEELPSSRHALRAAELNKRARSMWALGYRASAQALAHKAAGHEGSEGGQHA
ncbi:MAG: hypothetical protein EOP36_00050 [Rubrivivax sp.]|nr:MAG: hypothetical protein EOP36_00050 [Rubrivivax sp.]